MKLLHITAILLVAIVLSSFLSISANAIHLKKQKHGLASSPQFQPLMPVDEFQRSKQHWHQGIGDNDRRNLGAKNGWINTNVKKNQIHNWPKIVDDENDLIQVVRCSLVSPGIAEVSLGKEGRGGVEQGAFLPCSFACECQRWHPQKRI